VSLLFTVGLVAVVLAVTAALLAALFAVCVDDKRRQRYRHDRDLLYDRLLAVVPFVAVLAGVLVINKGLQARIVAFSYRYGVDPTPLFYAVEGDTVAWLQGIVPGWATLYFSGMYVFGYAVLLTFPLVAYLFASSTRPLKTLVAAYGINYAVAIVCYAAVRAYGPRTYHERSESAATVSHGLVDLFPDIVYLTSLVNSQTNVFPSLHTSLSVTVLAVAVTTHAEFPRWTPVAFVLARASCWRRWRSGSTGCPTWSPGSRWRPGASPSRGCSSGERTTSTPRRSPTGASRPRTTDAGSSVREPRVQFRVYRLGAEQPEGAEIRREADENPGDESGDPARKERSRRQQRAGPRTRRRPPVCGTNGCTGSSARSTRPPRALSGCERRARRRRLSPRRRGRTTG